MTPPTVAIAGASGNLGQKVTRAFLSPTFRHRFRDIVILSRKECGSLQQFVDGGAKVRLYNEDCLADSLDGIDVLVNTIGPTGHAFKEKLLHALPSTSIKLYFPSEFGVDHTIHDFSHAEWDAKKRHLELAKQILPPSGIRICRVFAGLFLEDSIAVGDPSQRTSYTSMEDVGRAVAVLASSPVDTVPERIHLSGDDKSIEEIAQIMEQSAGKIQVSTIDLDEYKQAVLANPSPTPERYLRFLMGEGKIDHSKANGKQIVNPDESLWKWKSMHDLAEETGGRPWAEYKWEF